MNRAMRWAIGGVGLRVGLGLLVASALGCGESSGSVEVVEGTVASADGTEIWYRSVGGADADDTLLLMHGGPGVASHYLLGFEQLASPSRRVVRLDQRGVGGSAPPPNDDFDLARILEDVEAVRAAVGAAEVTFVGHSWGGLVGMHYAIEHPERVRALLLLDTLPATAARLRAGFSARQARITQMQEDGVIAAQIPSSTTDLCGWVQAIMPVYFADPTFVPPPELADNACVQTAARLTWDQNVDDNYDLAADLAARAMPVGVIWGEGDFFAAQQPATAEAFEPDASTREIPAAGHFPWMEAPDPAFEAVREFLDAR